MNLITISTAIIVAMFASSVGHASGCGDVNYIDSEVVDQVGTVQPDRYSLSRDGNTLVLTKNRSNERIEFFISRDLQRKLHTRETYFTRHKLQNVIYVYGNDCDGGGYRMVSGRHLLEFQFSDAEVISLKYPSRPFRENLRILDIDDMY